MATLRILPRELGLVARPKPGFDDVADERLRDRLVWSELDRSLGGLVRLQVLSEVSDRVPREERTVFLEGGKRDHRLIELESRDAVADDLQCLRYFLANDRSQPRK